MNIETIKLDRLNPAEYNPRTITSDEFRGLCESLKTFGQQENLIVNKDMTIISGHQRYNAMLKLGWTEAVCNVVDLDKHQEKKLNVLMNSTAISGKYDDLKLAEILEELKLDEDYESLRLDKLEPLDLSENNYDEPELEFSDELLLEHNYIVLYFDNAMDWEVAVDKFNLKNVKTTATEKSTKVGLGRVVNGKDYI